MSDLAARLSAALSDRYRLERELGQGGMATVYLAQDLKHRRQVAIKVLRPELAAMLGPERFLREIETTANLRHPHILPLYDSGEAEGFLFYVMPLVEGESLRSRLDRVKQLPIDEALGIAREVADALGYAHSRGIIHRDIKPENILLEGGHAVVADFGIARAVSAAGAEKLTRTGMSVGTPSYMSPEQAAGEESVDGRSDLYALGCVLYEMLGGQPPFTGPTVESVVHQHLMVEPPPITNLRPTVPVEVAGALARTLAKNPADRFNPAAQFVQALSTPMSRPTTATTRRSSPRRLLIAGGAVAIVAAAWFGGRALLGERRTANIERIAVLPMDNQTGDTTQAFFADGMTRELIGVLTDAGVRVLGHRAVAAYRNTTLSAGEIAGKLGVDAIITGAVLQAGEVVQIAAELTDPKTGENLWARTFSRPASDVVTLQHDVAGEIARGIRARLTPDQERVLAQARPVNPKAYAQYLLGVEQVNVRSPEGYRRSVEYLSRSLALDPTFAPAWASLAMTHAIAIFFQMAAPDSAKQALEQAAARARALDDRLGDPLIARGMARFLVDWDFTGAEALFDSGMQRNPSTQGQAVYSWFPWETGQFDKAIAAATRLIDLEPTTAQWHSDLGWDYYSAGRAPDARAAALRAIALDSAFYEPYHLLAWLEFDAGNFPVAREMLDRAAQTAGGDFWIRGTLEGLILVRTATRSGSSTLCLRCGHSAGSLAFRPSSRGWVCPSTCAKPAGSPLLFAMRTPRELAEEQAWLIAASLIIIATVATGAALIYMRPALVPFVLAVFLYYLVTPLADLLESRARFPRWASTITTLLVVAALIGLTGLLITISTQGLVESADIYRERLAELTRRAVQALNSRGINLGQESFLEAIRGWSMTRVFQTTVATAFNLVTNGVLVLIMVIFLLLGRRRQMVMSAVFREVDAKIKRFLVLKFIISAVTGVLVGTILTLLGLKMALVFGVLTFFLNFIPSVGSIVAVLLPLPVALVQYDTTLPVIAVLVLPGIVQMVIGNGIDPKLMGRGLDLSPVTVLVALVFWGLVWGVVGMLLAAPMTGILRIVLAQFATTRPVSEILAGRLPEAGQSGTWEAPHPPNPVRESLETPPPG